MAVKYITGLVRDSIEVSYSPAAMLNIRRNSFQAVLAVVVALLSILAYLIVVKEGIGLHSLRIPGLELVVSCLKGQGFLE